MPASQSQSPGHRAKELYEFGPFRVDPDKEVLLRAGQPVPLTPKTFQILLVLVRHSTEVVAKDDLMKSVWPDTFVEEANLSRNIFMLRKALCESPQDRYIVTVPGRGYRLAENVHLVPESELSIVAAKHSSVQVEVRETRPWVWISVALVLLIGIAAVAFRLLAPRSTVLTEKDAVVLADFANSTGDPVFDGTLRQGMAVQLEQSPFLTLISDRQIRQTLRMMGQPADARLTPEIAREICERTGSAAVLQGSIASLGNQYVLGLRAENCRGGEVLDDQQVQAARKEDILKALDSMAIALRSKLGESLSSVQKYATPLEEATTPSLDALKAYSMGRKTGLAKGYTAALPFYRSAVELDPNFAIAYRAMSAAYISINEDGRSAETARKAHELSSKVSEREKFAIDGNYELMVTGDLDKAAQVYELWRQVYPRDYLPRLNLSTIYSCRGNWEKALEETREALRLEPNSEVNYANLGTNYADLNRWDEAESVYRQAQARNLEGEVLLADHYRFAFLQGDTALMAHLASATLGKPGIENSLLATEADTAAWSGELTQSRELTRRAMDSAERSNATETAAAYQAEEALREAEFDEPQQARADTKLALKLSPNHDVRDIAALALARAGDAATAEKMAAELDKEFPSDTLIHTYWLPTIRAAIALDRTDPNHAIEVLETVRPLELGQPTPLPILLRPVYVRGRAYLAAGRGQEAAVEFQKILDHRGLMRNDPVGALARLQLGRAYALMGDNTKAKTAYQDFFTLWKDADPDIAILKQSKAEYAKLQ